MTPQKRSSVKSEGRRKTIKIEKGKKLTAKYKNGKHVRMSHSV